MTRRSIIGDHFGHLTPIREGPKRLSNGERQFVCLCDPERGGCGKETGLVGLSNLVSGNTVSCGCKAVVRAAALSQRKTWKCCVVCGVGFVGITRQKCCSRACARRRRLGLKGKQ